MKFVFGKQDIKNIIKHQKDENGTQDIKNIIKHQPNMTASLSKYGCTQGGEGVQQGRTLP
jgi:hypothetical protein